MSKQEPPMILRSLTLERKTWGQDEGKFTGKASFTGPHADIAINLGPDHVRSILDMCADQLIETTRQVAGVIRDDIIKSITPGQERKLLK
jgi:hypothetical protein